MTRIGEHHIYSVIPPVKLDQLRLIASIADHDYNVSRAAAAADAPQPALSRLLRALERELGVDVFVRAGNRLRGPTGPGEEILALARRVLADVDRIATVARDFSDSRSGRLTIATTHTQARYALPAVIRRFSERYPSVELMIKQASPAAIVELVRNGEADICIGSESAEGEELLQLPCYSMHRVVITPPDHPLLRMRGLTLESLARYPIITYDAPALGRSRMVQAFAAHGLTPKIVLSAIDSDVIKAYVEQGLGIAIVAELAFDRERDTRLRAINARRLFEPNTIHIGMRRNDYLRGYVFDLIELFAPRLTRDHVTARLRRFAARREVPGR